MRLSDAIAPSKVWGEIPPALAAVGNVFRFTQQAVDVYGRRQEEKAAWSGGGGVRVLSVGESVPRMLVDTPYVVHQITCFSRSAKEGESRFDVCVEFSPFESYRAGRCDRISEPSLRASAYSDAFKGITAHMIMNVIPVHLHDSFPRLRSRIQIKNPDGSWRQATVLAVGVDAGDNDGYMPPEIYVSNPRESEKAGTWHRLDGSFREAIRVPVRRKIAGHSL